jgi:hypothetical protein
MSKITELYDKLQTREKRVVLRLMRALSSETDKFDGDELTKICRIINRQSRRKKGKTGYILYYTQNYQKIKEKNPDLTLGQIAKKIGQKWSKLSDDEQSNFNKKAVAENTAEIKKKLNK